MHMASSKVMAPYNLAQRAVLDYGAPEWTKFKMALHTADGVPLIDRFAKCRFCIASVECT